MHKPLPARCYGYLLLAFYSVLSPLGWCSACYAAPATVDSVPTQAALGATAQRKTFYDTVNSRYWLFYSDGSALRYAWSPDSASWSLAGTLPYETEDFAVAFRALGGVPYVFLAAASSHDIILLRGRLTPASIVFASPSTVFDGAYPGDSYNSPTVALDDSGYVWTAAVHNESLTTEDHLVLAARRSTHGAGDISAWNTADTIGRRCSTLRDAVIMPLTGSDMYLLANSDSGSLLGYRYQNSTWVEAAGGGDYSWFSFPGRPDNTVRTLLASDGTLYAGGDFEGGIAKWDGVQWTIIGGGFNSTVFALAMFNGRLYAGGSFSDDNFSYLAQWDGQAWGAVPLAPNGNVRALAVAGGSLYVGGTFERAGDLDGTHGIARWDASTWHAVGSGLPLNNHVYAMAAANGYIYAGGFFFNIQGDPDANKQFIAKWNVAGSSWEAMGSGLHNTVYTIAAAGSDVYVGGNFTAASGDAGDFIVRWAEEDDSWHAVGTGLNDGVNAIVISGATIYAGGDFTDVSGDPLADHIAKFENGAWEGIGASGVSQLSGSVYALGLYSGRLIAGGGFAIPSASTMLPLFIASFDGSSWSSMGAGFSNDVSAIEISGSDIYLGGRFLDAFGIGEADYIVHWDGSNWSALGSGLNGPVESISVHNGRVYAAGYFTNAGGAAAADYVAVWDPADGFWHALGGESVVPSGLSAVIAADSGVYIGGGFFNLAGIAEADGIARWDGSAWHALGTGLNSSVADIAVVGGTVYAAGYFTNAGGVEQADYIAYFKDDAWNALGTGAPQAVFDLAPLGGDLYVAGNFASIGGVAGTRGLARWDGGAWNSVGGGLGNGIGTSIAAAGTKVYVGGSFTKIEDETIAALAAYDGTSWSGLGAPLAISPEVLAADRASLYAGGSFIGAADGHFSTFYFAKYGRVVAAEASSTAEVSAVSDSAGNLHLLYENTAGQLIYRRYNAASTAWSAPVQIAEAPVESFTAVFDQPNGHLYAFWMSGGTVQYKKAAAPYGAPQWEEAAAALYEGAAGGSLSGAETDGYGRLVVFWTFGSASPYSIVTDNLDLRYTLSGTVNVNGYGLEGVTVAGAGLGSTVTAADGTFSYRLPANTAYSVSCAKPQFSFAPGQAAGTLTADTQVDFTAEPLVATPVFALWNSFLGMLNIVEIQNVGDTAMDVAVTMYDISGEVVDQVVLPVAARGQYDLILNEMTGFAPSSYGIIRLDFSKPQFEGRVFYYRPSGGGQYDFAFAVPFNNPLSGTSYAAFNTLQPSLKPEEAGNMVEQWLALVNLHPTSTRTFTVRQYSQSGELIDTQRVPVGPFSRADVNGGHALAGLSPVGLNEIIPEDPSDSYIAQLFRYGANAGPGAVPTAYKFAFPLLASGGTSHTIYAPVSRGAGASDWLELVNCADAEAAVNIRFFNHLGEELQSGDVPLYRHGQHHVNVADFLPEGETGLAIITPNAGAAVIAQSMFYFRNIDGSIAAMYGSQARESYGTELIGSYNLFLGMYDWLKMINLRDAETNVTLRLFHPDGQVTTLALTLPAHGGMDRGLHESAVYGTARDTYGIISITAAQPGSVYSELLRLKPGAAGGVDFAAPTMVR